MSLNTKNIAILSLISILLILNTGCIGLYCSLSFKCLLGILGILLIIIYYLIGFILVFFTSPGWCAIALITNGIDYLFNFEVMKYLFYILGSIPIGNVILWIVAIIISVIWLIICAKITEDFRVYIVICILSVIIWGFVDLPDVISTFTGADSLVVEEITKPISEEINKKLHEIGVNINTLMKEVNKKIHSYSIKSPTPTPTTQAIYIPTETPIAIPTPTLLPTPIPDDAYVFIKGGTFMMGSNNSSPDEKPIHSVTLSDFYIRKYEVTNREYCLFDPNHDNPGDNLPVVNVSWNDAVAYCQWLSEKTGKNYRLPTEAEFEYACRAGTTTNYYWGDKIDRDYCWYEDNSDNQIHPVGQKKPNAWELYDMSGNVGEWCGDWYGDYSSDKVNNPTGSKTGKNRMARGGNFEDFACACQSSYRNYDIPYAGYCGIGFRVVMVESSNTNSRETTNDLLDVVKENYTYISNKDFKKAYDLRSKYRKSKLSYDEFSNVWKDNITIRLENAEIIEQTDKKAVVKVKLYSEDPDKKKSVTEKGYYNGELYLIKENSEWKLNDSKIEKESSEEKNTNNNEVTLFYESMTKGDLETMYSLVTPEKGKDISQACDNLKNDPNTKINIITTAFLVAGMVKNGQGQIKHSDMNMTIKNLSDTNIQVKLTYTSDAEFEDQKSIDKNEDTVLLKKINNKWYIVDIIDNLKENR